MTEENERLRNTLKATESIVTTTLRSQPEDDAKCKEHLEKALVDILHLVLEELNKPITPIGEITKELRERGEYNLNPDHSDIDMTTQELGEYQIELADRIETAIAGERK